MRSHPGQCFWLMVLCLVFWPLSLSAQDPEQPAEPPEDLETTVSQDDAPLPDYLQELRKLAQDHLESGDIGDSDLPVTPGRRPAGPISREEYSRYVGGADFSGRVEPDSVSVTRPVIPRVVITDRNAIDYLFECCAYDEAHPDSVEFIEIYDFSRSGFSNGDMMVVHPSGRSYILEGLDAEFLDSAALWEHTGELRFRSFHRETEWMDDLITTLSPPDYYDWEAPPPVLSAPEEEDQALRAIWGDLHRAVDGQYGRGPLELYFARDDTTTTIEFWGYEADSLDFQYLGAGSGHGRNDLLTVTVSDTLVTAYRTYVDVLVVKDSRVDTIFVHPADAGR